MRENLLQDILQVERNLGLPTNKSPAERMEAIVATQSTLISSLSMSMSPLNDGWILEPQPGVKTAAGGITGALDAIKGSAGFTWISNAYDRVQSILNPVGSQKCHHFEGVLCDWHGNKISVPFFSFSLRRLLLYPSAPRPLLSEVCEWH